jgi:broad specificity phosphatase PhoE
VERASPRTTSKTKLESQRTKAHRLTGRGDLVRIPSAPHSLKNGPPRAGEASGALSECWPDGNIPGYETQDSLITRGTRAIRSLAGEYPGQRLVVVTHGALLNAILSAVSSGEIGSGKTRLANACINLLSHSNGDWTVESYNEVGHLASITHLDNE